MSLTQHLQEMKQEHEGLTRTINVMRRCNPDYVPGFAFDDDFDTWLAMLDQQAIEAQEMDERAEWQASLAMGFSLS
jgi:hypothetical protein